MTAGKKGAEAPTKSMPPFSWKIAILVIVGVAVFFGLYAVNSQAQEEEVNYSDLPLIVVTSGNDEVFIDTKAEADEPMGTIQLVPFPLESTSGDKTTGQKVGGYFSDLWDTATGNVEAIVERATEDLQQREADIYLREAGVTAREGRVAERIRIQEAALQKERSEVEDESFVLYESFSALRSCITNVQITLDTSLATLYPEPQASVMGEGESE